MPIRQKAVAGFERRQPIDRNGRVRLMCRARGLRHQGLITRAAVDVMAALCDRCNRGTGACFPSYETLAEDAGCARSTVAIALQALWAVGLIDWAHRLVRVREHCERSCRWITKVMRTSNGYLLLDPLLSSKSDFPTRTPKDQKERKRQAVKEPTIDAALPVNHALEAKLRGLGEALAAAFQASKLAEA